MDLPNERPVLLSHRVPLSLHIISSFGHLSGLLGPAPSGPLLLALSPFLASLELLESRQAQSCPQGICPCCSPHSSEIAMDFPSYLPVSMQRALLRRPSCTILFKTATRPLHQHTLPLLPALFFFSALITTCRAIDFIYLAGG